MPPEAPRTAPPFPTRFPFTPQLVLPRRNRIAPPTDWGLRTPVAPDFSETERALRQLEQSLAERERLVAETQVHLAERARDLDELEALLRARETLLDSARLADTDRSQVVTLREAEALHELKAELDRQEASLRESRAALRERERFLEESETRLFAKVQEQQEKETELEQREENLANRSEAPRHAAPTPFDEFRE